MQKFLVPILSLLCFIVSSQNSIRLGKYELEPYTRNGITLYNNLKVFTNSVATESNIMSLSYFPQTPYQRQHHSLGLKLIKTGYQNKTISIVFSENKGNLPADKVYQGNNRLIHRSQMFMHFEDQYRNTVFRELVFQNTDHPPYANDYKVPEKIEINENGNIETYRVNEITIGNGIGAFIGTTQSDGNKHLFVHRFSKKDPYRKYDFIGASDSFKQLQNAVYFNGTIKTKNGIEYLRNKPVWLDKVFNTDTGWFAFFKTNGLDALIPVKLNKDGSVKVFSEAILNSNYKRTSKYSTAKERVSDVHYMPYSGGFLNHYYDSNVKPNDVTIELYNSYFERLLKMTINDFQVKHAIEYSHYIILGGYTENKGYRGYANPKIIVIDRKTKKITFEKAIPLKNHQVDFINLTSESGVLLFTIGSPCCKTNYDTDKALKPQIIIDRLQPFGVFENDLFTPTD